MPIHFVNFFIENAIENSLVISRDQLIDLVKMYPDNIYPKLSKLWKVETEILEIVFIKNNDRLRLLKYAPDELRADELFILELIKRDINTIGFINESKIKNIDFVKKIIFANPESIYFLYEQFITIYNTFRVEFDEKESENLKGLKSQDYELLSKTRPLINILKLHKKGGITPKLIEKINSIESDNHKQLEYSTDFHFNRTAYLQNSTPENSNVLEKHNRLAESLIYLPEAYKNDKEVVLKLIAQISTQFILVDNPLEMILSNLSDALKNDQDVALAFLEKSTKFITSFSDNIKNTKNIASVVLKNDGLMLKYFSKEIRSDHELVELAVQNNAQSYFYADNSIRIKNGNKNNNLLLYNALRGNVDLIMHIDKEWLKDKIVIQIVANKRPMLLELF